MLPLCVGSSAKFTRRSQGSRVSEAHCAQSAPGLGIEILQGGRAAGRAALGEGIREERNPGNRLQLARSKKQSQERNSCSLIQLRFPHPHPRLPRLRGREQKDNQDK